MYEFPEFISQLPRADIPLDGLKAHLLQGDDRQVLFMVFTLDARVPPHFHGAQWGTVLDGAIDLTVDGVQRTYSKGDSYFIPAGTPHGGKLRPGFRAVDYFADPERYKPRGKTS